jgi:hypothetical protein
LRLTELFRSEFLGLTNSRILHALVGSSWVTESTSLMRGRLVRFRISPLSNVRHLMRWASCYYDRCFVRIARMVWYICVLCRCSWAVSLWSTCVWTGGFFCVREGTNLKQGVNGRGKSERSTNIMKCSYLYERETWFVAQMTLVPQRVTWSLAHESDTL